MANVSRKEAIKRAKDWIFTTTCERDAAWAAILEETGTNPGDVYAERFALSHASPEARKAYQEASRTREAAMQRAVEKGFAKWGSYGLEWL